MKKDIFLFLLISLSMLTACNREDEVELATEIIPIELAGDWTLTETTSENGKFSTQISGVPFTGRYTVVGEDITAKISFTEALDKNEENTFIGTGGITFVASIKIPLNSFEFRDPLTNLFNAGTWTLEGSKLTTITPTEETVFEILTLSENLLVVRKDINETTTQQGYDITLTGDQILKFTK